ncbi:M2 family metallopeptidase [bacterium]|nr:M2 family metallopeptidase [bacterium]
MNNATSPSEFIERHIAEIEPLEKKTALAYWQASLSGREEDFQRVAEIEKKILTIYARRDEFVRITAFHGHPGDIADPLLARQIDLLYRRYKSAQGDTDLLRRIVDLENALQQAYQTFRATFRGEKRTNNYLQEILRTTRDSKEAREAWEALKQVGENAAPRIVELVRLRNQHAQELGSENYYVFSLELKELDQDKLFALLKDLERQSNPLFETVKEELDEQLASEFSIAPADLRPWHYRNPFFQEMPPNNTIDLDPIFADRDIEGLARSYYQGIGLDISRILERSDLYEKEGKDQHAFCIGIDVPEDVRVLCNVRPSERWMSTMLHEFGHAVYDHYLDPALPFVLRSPAHTLTTEAIAMLNERFLQSAEFLSGIAGMERAKAEELEIELHHKLRRKMLVFLRWALVMIHFERALYEDPDQDLSQLWWRTVLRYQWLNGPERWHHPDWASKIHLASAPVYYQNYLLGEMNASQILAALRHELTPPGAARPARIVANPQTGEFFRDRIFRAGASKPWNERLREATGETLNPDHYMNDMRPSRED